MSWVAVGVAGVGAVGSIAGGMLGGSKSKQQQQNVYNNPTLGAYTSAYRDASPWGFATLDPDATLAAMGGGTSVGGKELGGAFRKKLLDMSDAEKEESKQTDAVLKRIQERQESGQFLTSRETDFINQSLDKAFEYAHKTGYADWEKATQMLAGSRGLRMSDTPVAEPALRELRNFELGLGSQRAELGLNATLDLSKNQQLFDAGFAQFQQTLSQNRWNARQGFLFGGGMQGAGNVGYTGFNSGMTTNTPSPLSTMSTIAGMAGNAMMAYGSQRVPTSTTSSFGGFGGGGYGGMMGMTSGSLGGMFGK